MRLLERELQLGALHDYAADARRDDGRLVLVSGEAGIGKSSLVEAFVDGLTDARLAWTSCDGAFTPSALGPLQDVADQWGGAVRVACAEGVPRDARFAALLSMLREHGEGGGLSVLVLEDLHFADEATLDLVRHVARRLRGVRAMVVATYRDDGLAENRALRETLGDASTIRSTRRIALPPLSPSAVTELSQASGHEPDAVHALTGGNPFFVSEVLRAEGEELPASARDAVLARAARLSPRWTGGARRRCPGRRAGRARLARRRHRSDLGSARRARRRRPARGRRCGAAVPSRDRPPRDRAGGRPAHRRRDPPPHPRRARAVRSRRRPTGAPRRGRARRRRRRPLRTSRRRQVRRAGVAARGRVPVPPRVAVRRHRPTTRASRPPRRAGPRARRSRPVGASRRGL